MQFVISLSCVQAIHKWTSTSTLQFPNQMKTQCIMHNTHTHEFLQLLRQSEELELDASAEGAALLTADREIDLLKKIGDFPQVVADAARLRAPHRVATYIQELAATFHSFYNAEKVLDPA